MTIHWEEGEDQHGLPTWLQYADCGHWGLILTAVSPRYSFNVLCGWSAIYQGLTT